MSQGLVWLLTKDNNAFKRKQQYGDFTTNPFSVTGKNTYSGQGFSRKGTVALTFGLDKKKAKETQNRFHVAFRKRQRYPQHDVTVNKTANPENKGNFFAEHLTVKHGLQRVGKVIRKRYVNKTGYQKLALKKLYKMHKTQGRVLTAQRKEEKEAKKQ